MENDTCSQCKNWTKKTDKFGSCRNNKFMWDRDDFCSSFSKIKDNNELKECSELEESVAD